jgi:hypothetical protein
LDIEFLQTPIKMQSKVMVKKALKLNRQVAIFYKIRRKNVA